eukprot:UN11004
MYTFKTIKTRPTTNTKPPHQQQTLVKHKLTTNTKSTKSKYNQPDNKQYHHLTTKTHQNNPHQNNPHPRIKWIDHWFYFKPIL